MPKLADNPQTENAKKVLEEERKVSEKSRVDFAERAKGKPTPTQEENDLAMLGAHILEHDDDGSGPDPYNVSTRQMEADRPRTKPQTYQTKEQQAKPTT